MTDPEPEMSEEDAERRLTVNRNDASAMLAKADHRFLAKDRRAANAYYRAVLQLADHGHKVSTLAAQRARNMAEMIEANYSIYLVDALTAAGFERSDWHPRFAKSLRVMFGEEARAPVFERYPQQPRTYFYPDLPYLEFGTRSDFNWIETIEANTPEVLREAAGLMEKNGTFAPYVKESAQRPQGDVHGLLNNRDWSTFDLTDKGHPVAERVELCPKTHETIVDNVEFCDIPNRAPSIMFSLLQPKARIPAHTGMINTRLVCHLPLIVPGEGALRVGHQTRKWKKSEIMIFDDTVEHEAWNDADESRLVLIFDIWRPEISKEERSQIRAMFAAVDAY